MPDKEIREFLRGKRAIIIPELNYTGQFAKVIEHRYNVEVIRFNKYEGLPFTAGEIERKILEVADSLVSRVLSSWRKEE
jgi:2-oxoglutarate ferredoxin oxidoreductase subunit alpha